MFDTALLLVPDECYTYNVLDSPIRSTSNDNDTYYCDDLDYPGRDSSPDWKGTSWYRFQLPSSSGRMPEQPVPTYHCGTHAPGWLNAVHPQQEGDIIEANVCFHLDGNTCAWKKSVIVKNCGSYYVYHLPDVPNCSLTYCASATTPKP